MSWNKNTYSFSDITPIVRELIRTKEKYYLFTIDKIEAQGLNDLFHDIENYDIRLLIYKGGIVLEQMRKTCDYDNDDVIVSECFNLNELPEKWPIIRIMDYYDYDGCKEYEQYVSLIKYKHHIEEFINEK